MVFKYSPIQYTNADRGRITEPKDTHGNGIEIKYSVWFVLFFSSSWFLPFFWEFIQNITSFFVVAVFSELTEDVLMVVLRFLNLPASMIFEHIHETFLFTVLS